MSSRENKLRSILSNIAIPEEKASEDSEIQEKLTEGAIDLLEALGYESENLFLNLELETPKIVRRETGWGIIPFDVIAAKRITAPPYVAVKTNLSSEEATFPPYGGKLIDWDSRFLGACARTSDAEYTIVLTNAYLAIAQSGEPAEVYLLSDIDDEVISDITDKLSPPNEFPEGLSDHFPAGYHPNQTKLTRWLFPDSEITPEYRSRINSPFFELDIDEYADRLYEAYTARSSEEKGDTLEDVVKFLFEALTLVEIRDRNLHTRTGEIDLVLEYSGSTESNLFEYQSRFLLVECKNISESVSTKEVAHFEKKLLKSDVSLGFLVSWNGISGEESGEYAQRYVDSDAPDESTIVVIDSRDLYRILDGVSLYDLIDEKLYSLRFDI